VQQNQRLQGEEVAAGEEALNPLGRKRSHAAEQGGASKEAGAV
jgi:hypothetical protein